MTIIDYIPILTNSRIPHRELPHVPLPLQFFTNFLARMNGDITQTLEELFKTVKECRIINWEDRCQVVTPYGKATFKKKIREYNEEYIKLAGLIAVLQRFDYTTRYDVLDIFIENFWWDRNIDNRLELFWRGYIIPLTEESAKQAIQKLALSIERIEKRDATNMHPIDYHCIIEHTATHGYDRELLETMKKGFYFNEAKAYNSLNKEDKEIFTHYLQKMKDDFEGRERLLNDTLSLEEDISLSLHLLMKGYG